MTSHKRCKKGGKKKTREAQSEKIYAVVKEIIFDFGLVIYIICQKI